MLVRITIVAIVLCLSGGRVKTHDNILDREKLLSKGSINDKFYNCPAEDDPRYQILFPHPFDCSKYYMCSNGVAYLKECSSGLHFSNLNQKCDYPQEAGCNKEILKKPKGKTGREIQIDECPTSNSLKLKHLPHATDCNKFYTCDSGVPHLKTCLPGLHFNRKLEVCDYPDRAGCDTYATETSVDKEEDANLKGKCPLKTTGHPVLLPHSSDCGKFYICNNGVPHIKSCQPGLHFNDKLQICDYPKNAGCDLSNTKKPREKSIEDEEKCLSNPSAEPGFIAIPQDCSKFIVCHHGRQHIQNCPPGLHFNVKIKACDYPENAKCNEALSSDLSHHYGPGVPSAFCPPVNGKSLVFYLHPSNCSVYYLCNHGLAFEFACPSGLHFNLQKKVCDYEWLAGCEKVFSSDVKYQHGPGVPSPFCPPTNGKSLVFYLHPSNCSVYYLCNHGLAFEFTCPSGLHFNLQKKVCDYEELAGCEEDD